MHQGCDVLTRSEGELEDASAATYHRRGREEAALTIG